SERFQIALPSSWPLEPMADANEQMVLSPDGETLVYVGQKSPDGPRQLLRRRLDSLAVAPIPGTESVGAPLSFSPDGRWLAFFAGRALKKVAAEGGASVILCDHVLVRGASWGEDGTIVFTPGSFRGLSRVPAEGGSPTVLTTPDDEWSSHRWPQFLPGSRAVLFTAASATGRMKRSRVEVVDVATRERRGLIEGANF